MWASPTQCKTVSFNDSWSVFERHVKISCTNVEPLNMFLVGNWLLETLEHLVTKIILTMCEIQKIHIFLKVSKIQKNIFCVSNITFFHSMFLVINLQNNSKSLTQRKLFGAYFHFISWHATNQYRLFSGRSAKTEMGEFFLVVLKQILN